MKLKCTQCQAALEVPDSASGKLIQCPRCSSQQRVPKLVQADVVTPGKPLQQPPPARKPQSSTGFDAEPDFNAAAAPQFSDEPQHDPLSAPIGRPDIGISPALLNRPSQPKPRTSQQPRAASQKSMMPVFIIGGSVVAALLLFGFISIGAFAFLRAARERADASGVDSTPGSKLEVESPALTLPRRGSPTVLSYKGATADVYEIDFGAVNRSGTPGSTTQLRVYVPSGGLPRNSTPCVLIAPAGTNLMTGTDINLGNSDYHDETMPYVMEGMIVIQYSLDGWAGDFQKMSDRQAGLELARAYKEFSAAKWGVLNAKIALDYCLATFPEIDQREIYSTGHSSAGTLSLMLAASEPRLKKCIAYAPACSLRKRFGDFLDDPSFKRLLPGVTTYANVYSPDQQVMNIECPIFLFHARDDSNVPFQDTTAYAAALDRANKVYDHEWALRGDHYQSMIDEGIPSGIAWLKSGP